MPVRIHYIALPKEESQGAVRESVGKKFAWGELLDRLTHQMTLQMSQTGFLRLYSMKKGKEREAAYFSHTVNGILADFTNRSTLVSCKSLSAELVVDEFDSFKSQFVCHLQGGLLHDDEYQKLLQMETTESKEKKALCDLPVVTAKPCKIYGNTGEVYGIPIFRCALDTDWVESPSAYMLLKYLVGKDFLPAVGLELGNAVTIEKLWEFLRNNKSAKENNYLAPVQKADKDGSEEEKRNWDAIKAYYRGTGHRTANLSEYPESLLLIQGSWELYPFAGLEREKLSPIEGNWYEVSGLYARNPQEDIATDAEYVAIDFGTTSTVAAVYQDNGEITTMPVGGGEGCGQIDNPTILKFVDIRNFLAAYVQSSYRPDTEFEQVTVSHNAKNDFETPAQKGSKKNMLQYLSQLKQWVNQPNRTIQLRDRQGDRDITLGRKMDADTLTIDPIELYAYYIGLSINNMRWGKIYLRYLLSYSATYSMYSREWIRASFEKGLRKALPPEVGETAEIDVRLWQDEATAYAICALERYLMAEEDAYEQEQGIFYGIYDFGGGTLDFSFGIMEPDPETGKMHFTQLQQGGSPVLGCENILDELAFQIFIKNAPVFQRQNRDIKCNIPLGADLRQYLNNPMAGESEAARFNTCSMVAYLRKKWIAPGKENSVGNGLEEESSEFDSLTLYDEDGSYYEWTGKDRSDENEIEMEISDKEIQEFFSGKVSEGIDLFLDCYQKVISKKENQEYSTWPCHIFLAGSASQAACVPKLFQGKITSGKFTLHPPLPTDQDKKEREKNPYMDIPTAKSGVAYGLLLSRPGAEEIVIKSKLPDVNFHYHIGCRVKGALYGGKGMFRLLLEKTCIPKYEEGEFRKLREIPQKIFEILYTFDDSYTLAAANRKVGNSVKVLSITVPDEYAGGGYCLYIRALRDSDIKAELGAAPAGNDRLDVGQVCKIGICDFGQGNFLPEPREAVGSGEDPEAQEDKKPADKIRKDVELNKKSVPGIAPAVPNCYNLGVLQADGMPSRQFSTDIFQTDKMPRHLCNAQDTSFELCYQGKGDSEWRQVTIPLEGDGVKKVFVLGLVGSDTVKIGYNSSGKKHDLYVNLSEGKTIGNYEGGLI